MRHIDFDLPVLRSFVAGMDMGSFAKAALQVGRSASALSAQIRRLEEQAGTALFRKSGRHLQLTEAGDTLLLYARRLIELNDEAAAAVRGIDLDGVVRLGMQEDFGETALPEVLGRFARAHPRVRIEAHVARNSDLVERMVSGQLDLALVWNDAPLHADGLNSDAIGPVPMCWIGSPLLAWSRGSGEPVPLVVFDRPCLFQRAAVEALERAGIAWRIAFTSPSLSGLYAASAAGLGIQVRTACCLPGNLARIGGDGTLPALPSIPLTLLHQARAQTPSVERLRTIILESVAGFASAPDRAAA